MTLGRSLPLLLALALALALPLASQDPDTIDVEAKEEREPKGPPLPLEPGRTVRIDLTEGTWMSLDVSPDGRALVFDYLGDLFTLPIEGGQATQLTSGMAFDAQPRFSPDGRRVVFTSDRSGGQNVWILSLDGRDTVQVTKGKANRTESPEWTPDGNYIVASVGDFRGRDLPTLTLYHARGGSGVPLLTRGDGDDDDDARHPKAIGAAFGAAGRWVWYAQKTGTRDWDYNAQLPQYSIRAYDRETGESYTRVSRYGSAFRPTLSPDGHWLVYGTRHEDQTGLVLRDLRSGDERWLAYPVQHDDQESRASLDVLPGMSFTPDSRSLVASYGGKIWRIPVEGGPATEIPFRVTFDQPIGPLVEFDYPIPDSASFTVRQIRDPAPSPDGRRVAFTALDRLYVAEADGSNPRALTAGTATEHHPAWSPDGEWIAYASWDGDAGHLMRVRANGRGAPQRLSAQPGVYITPAWSPDGARLVALRGQTRAFLTSSSPRAAMAAADEVVWFPAGGGQATLISPAEGRSDPHFVADEPDRIYFSGDDGELVSIRWDGTDEKTHVRVVGPRPPGSRDPLDADLVLMAPRGERALAQVNGQLYSVTVPQVGGKAPRISVADPDDAAFPVRKLTEIGGEFPAWSADSRSIVWSLGNALFAYDLERAAAVEDSLKAEADAEAEERDGEGEGKGYQPAEHRVVIRAERDIPRGTAVLRGARIVTMNGAEVIENGDVVVRDNRIAAVGPTGSVAVPDGARVIDVAGKTIVPGFIDTHAHMWPAWGLHRDDQWIYLANLAYGVTTTRDPQTSTSDVLTYADLVRAGRVIGPRVYSTGPGVFWDEDFESLDHARRVLRKYSDYFDTKTIKMYVAGNRQQRQWIIMASRELGLMPTTEGSLNIRQNLNETIDGYPGLEHSIPIYPVYDDVVKLFAEAKRAYTPTLLVAYGGPWAENYFFQTENVHGDPKLRRFTPHEELDEMTRRRAQWFLPEEHVFDDHARFVADLVAAGGRAGVGSHGQLQGLGYHWELWAMQSGGMPEHDALRTATILGAEAIGLDTDIGSIVPGKLADLVILDRNPLDDIRNSNSVRLVMKNGRLYEGETLNEIWPRERELPRMWWWEREPVAGELPGVR